MRKNPKEYAHELINKFWGTECEEGPEEHYLICKHLAKQCAVITIEELLNNIPWEDQKQASEDYQYFQSVKEAINNL